ncbi:metallophosphoesterase family protein [Brachybacterium muris]|uniref:Membrane protein n=1 Tax=Brachybacterium muris UCD-AY4 TaxID=1249481 RepID=A0A022L282_9MICO|nr:metallophosphoesterase [Brachybacterium muris]EYT50113.1 membrane protein [Brachybacterium muris UCD-AY4]MBM7500052.1 putative MPP superfamily phosphohydrolase [Brachybacterium muris]MCT1431297.1 metallophosphoesterase family protein [Brachybacterium muris]MCT1655193.1 metallophosphoesterase family protein [Brachybacterium muris]MCT1998805.1 metallophosphoesterase family protein [Brachybacterium muris]
MPSDTLEDPVDDAPTRRRRRLRRARIAHVTATTVVAVLGAILGVLLVPATTVDVGPLKATVHLRPSLQSETVILLPPVGEVSFDTHLAPVRVEARVQGVDIAQAETLLYSADARAELTRTVPEDLTGAAALNAALNALFAAVGAGLAVGLTFRRVRRSLLAAGSTAGVVAASVGVVSLTFRPEALYQPRFDGLLSQAAYVADIGQGTLADYTGYRDTLAEFVGQVSALYIAADSLSPGLGSGDVITVLHVSDIHDNPQAFDVIEQLDAQFEIDAVIDTGDIVSWGTPFEHEILGAIGQLDLPYVYITGNHDSAVTAATVAAQPNGIVLENEIVEVAGLRIAGVGDPRFAADDDSDAGGWREGDAAVQASVFQLGETITAHDAENPEATVDLALVHDPTQPEGLEGRVPLVLSGHMHSSSVELDRDGSGTDWMVVGSTGGALGSGGVRPVLDGGEPLDLTARLLYFDAETKRLVAYDDIVMGGLGLVSISIQRDQMPTEPPALEVPVDAETPPTPTPTDLEIEPGEGLPDEERVTPTDPSVPLPEGSDGGVG